MGHRWTEFQYQEPSDTSSTPMVRPINKKAEEGETAILKAIEGIKNRTYQSIGQAAAAEGVSKSTLARRWLGGKSRSEGQENNQLLTVQEENALATWISAATAAGNPVQHDFIREMVDKLIKTRIPDQDLPIPQIGSTWVPSFLRRHRCLKTKMTRAIETSRIKDVTKEQVLHFNEELRRVIREHNIRLEDIYNADETGIHTYFS